MVFGVDNNGASKYPLLLSPFIQSVCMNERMEKRTQGDVVSDNRFKISLLDNNQDYGVSS